MSLDRSLKFGGALVRHRSVLRRAERIVRLKDQGRLTEESSPLGLPKTISPRATTARKKPPKAKQAEGEAEAAPAAAPAEKAAKK